MSNDKPKIISVGQESRPGHGHVGGPNILPGDLEVVNSGAAYSVASDNSAIHADVYPIPHVYNHHNFFMWAAGTAHAAVVDLIEKVGKPTTGQLEVTVTVRWKE